MAPFSKPLSVHEFQGVVIGQLGSIKTSIARVEERQAANCRRIEILESKQSGFETRAERTGRHEIVRLQSELKEKHKAWIGWTWKAILIVFGSLIAAAVQRFK